jgi:hypothetical protein
MSLDVYLTVENAAVLTGSGIFVREAGATREISRAEWEEKFPGLEPVTLRQDEETGDVFHGNITHNLNRMAAEAGIYEACWRPEELGITRAAQLVEPLEKGLALLRSDPARFKVFNPENGWGDYEGLVAFVAAYLSACREWPEAEVHASR